MNTAANITLLETLAAEMGGYLFLDRVEASIVIGEDAVDVSRQYWCQTDTAGWSIEEWRDAVNDEIDSGNVLPVY